jgi:non-ribosomal peptide synthetase component E (peptide arylation enzyme)
LDDDGRLTVTDRIADIVNRGGEKISSVEAEDVLVRHASIAEAAVVALPDSVLAERVCAVVVLRGGMDAPTLDEIRSHFAAAGVARQKTPERLVVDDFPRTASGKVRKVDLRERLRA